MIDNGSTLWVEDDNLSLKEVAKTLNLDEPDDRFVRGAQVTGVAIYNQNNNYCFCVTSIIDMDNQKLQEYDDSCYEYEPIPIYQSGDNFDKIKVEEGKDFDVDLNDFIQSVENFRSDFNEQASKEVKEDIVYMQLPSKGFSGTPYYNYTTFKGGGKVVGSYTITQYRYDIYTYREDKTNKKITDLVKAI